MKLWRWISEKLEPFNAFVLAGLVVLAVGATSVASVANYLARVAAVVAMKLRTDSLIFRRRRRGDADKGLKSRVESIARGALEKEDLTGHQVPDPDVSVSENDAGLVKVTVDFGNGNLSLQGNRSTYGRRLDSMVRRLKEELAPNTLRRIAVELKLNGTEVSLDLDDVRTSFHNLMNPQANKDGAGSEADTSSADHEDDSTEVDPNPPRTVSLDDFDDPPQLSKDPSAVLASLQAGAEHPRRPGRRR